MQRKDLAFPFEVKSLNEGGSFSGYGAVFNNVDAYAEIIAQGAFARTLNEARQKGRMPAMLWQHRQGEPIGVWTDMREDQKGLFVEGQLALKTARGAEAYELLRMKALDGLSVGFGYVTYEADKTSGIWTLTDVDLWEVSVVTFPANDLARVGAVKTAIARGEVPDKRAFEAELRDVFGLSQRQAKALLAEGYDGIAQRDVDDLAASIRVLTQTVRGEAINA